MIGNDGRVNLAGKRVLVVEDEYFIALDVQGMLEQWGAQVVGPTSNPAAALALVGDESSLDLAILDVNLDGESDVYLVAEALRMRQVPMIFATGYDRSQIRRDFVDVPHITKPFDAQSFARALAASA